MEDMEKREFAERQALKPGFYEHYKSTPEDPRFYHVLGVAQDTETGERSVVYIPLYIDLDARDYDFDVRSVEMFTESVEHNGAVVQRFTYIGTEL